MTIAFANLGPQPKVFDHRLEDGTYDVTLTGELVRPKSYELARLNATLSGTVTLTCDRCGDAYEEQIDEKVTLLVTDSPYKRAESEADEQEYDIIEFLDGNVDIDSIIISEVNAIKYDYHKCSECS